ncbi:hypothetical protein ABEH87_19985 [Erwinia sp. Eh17-17]|uniref:hypothetical protein n=1 Tax=Erwinia sp. Eh17-17 TaxID=3080330 RepID=UPI0032088408
MNYTKKFNAVCIECIDEDDVLTLAVGDDKHCPENFFIISKFDEENLSTDDCIGFQSESTPFEIPSAIESVELSCRDLVITLNDDAAKIAGFKKTQALLNQAEDINKIKEYLQAIFEDSRAQCILK